jgi:hypothetical protein
MTDITLRERHFSSFSSYRAENVVSNETYRSTFNATSVFFPTTGFEKYFKFDLS